MSAFRAWCSCHVKQGVTRAFSALLVLADLLDRCYSVMAVLVHLSMSETSLTALSLVFWTLVFEVVSFIEELALHVAPAVTSLFHLSRLHSPESAVPPHNTAHNPSYVRTYVRTFIRTCNQPRNLLYVSRNGRVSPCMHRLNTIDALHHIGPRHVN